MLIGLLRVDGQALQLLIGRGVDATALRDELADFAATKEEPCPLIGSTSAGFALADLVHEISQLRAEVAALRTAIEQRIPNRTRRPRPTERDRRAVLAVMAESRSSTPGGVCQR